MPAVVTPIWLKPDTTSTVLRRGPASSRRGPLSRAPARDFGALAPGFVQADRDRLFPALDRPSRSTLERAAFPPMHRGLHAFRSASSVLGHDELPAGRLYAFLAGMMDTPFGVEDSGLDDDLRADRFSLGRSAPSV